MAKKKRKKGFSKNTRYKILNYYFYKEEFLKWHEQCKVKGLPQLDVNFQKRWQYILEFEKDFV